MPSAGPFTCLSHRPIKLSWAAVPISRFSAASDQRLICRSVGRITSSRRWLAEMPKICHLPHRVICPLTGEGGRRILGKEGWKMRELFDIAAYWVGVATLFLVGLAIFDEVFNWIEFKVRSLASRLFGISQKREGSIVLGGRESQ